MIPKRIVQIWNDERMEDMIPGLQAAVQTWRTLNPDYEHVYYSMRAARQFIADNYDAEVLEAFDTLVPGSYKADLFRYCELYKNGGFYVDIKCNCRVPLDEIMQEKPTATMLLTLDAPASNYPLLTGFFGMIPGKPFLWNAIQRCVRNVQARYYGNSRLDPTGPGLFGRSLRESLGYSPTTANCLGLYNRIADAIWCKFNVYQHGWEIVSNTGLVLVDNNTPGYSSLVAPTHYSRLWAQRAIYTDSQPMQKSPNNRLGPFLPRALRSR